MLRYKTHCPYKKSTSMEKGTRKSDRGPLFPGDERTLALVALELITTGVVRLRRQAISVQRVRQPTIRAQY